MIERVRKVIITILSFTLVHSNLIICFLHSWLHMPAMSEVDVLVVFFIHLNLDAV